MMTLDELVQNFNAQKIDLEEKLEKLEEDFASVKINPNGVTVLDFKEKLELQEQILRLDGAIQGILLAKQNCGIE